MAIVCSKCFADIELVAFISSQNQFGKCDFCGEENIPCIAIEELYDFFYELLEHFKPDPKGTSLISLLQENCNLFSSLDNARSILSDFLSKNRPKLSNVEALVNFSDEIAENVGYWDRLKLKLIRENRYFTDVNYLIEDLGWDGLLNTTFEIQKEQQFFRARLHHNSGEPPFPVQQMFCPPAKTALGGRANPLGIPYLYLCDNSETVLYEIRAAYLDEVSIGTFEVNPNLSRPVSILDFTDSGSIFHPDEVGDKIKARLLKRKISADLSKPMRRYDSELEYIPTQFICEFIKHHLRFDGIKFQSSLHKAGNNYVIFDQTLMTCVNVNQIKVLKVIIST
jgi:hypothetical protein